MVVQLYCLRPSLADSDIAREQLAIENAIRRVETESLHHLDNATQLLIPLLGRRSGLVPDISDVPAAVKSAVVSCRSAAKNEERVGSDLRFAPKLSVSIPGRSAELERLQNQIHHQSGSSTIARKLVPIAIMALLVFAATAPSAH